MLTRTPAADLASLAAAALPGRLVLLTWHDRDGRDAFMPQLDGRLLPRPFASVLLDAETGLRAGLARLPVRTAPQARLSLGIGGAAADAALPLDALAPDARALVAAHDGAVRNRLVGFVLEVGSFLMRAGDDPAFLRACRSLVGAGAAPSARMIATLPPGRHLVEAAGEVAHGWLHLGTRGVRRVPSRATGAGQVFLLLDAAQVGDLLVAVDGSAPPQRLAAPAATTPHLLGLLPGLESATAAGIASLVHAAVAPRAATDRAAGALLRELDLIVPRAPRRHVAAASPVAAALELALDDRGGGMFLRGWLRDPHGLVTGLSLRTATAEVPLPPAALFRVPRPELAARFARSQHAGDGPEGFVAHLAGLPGAGPQPDLLLHLASGASVQLVPPLRTLPPAAAREAVLASVAPQHASPALMERCIAPAAARLHAAALAGPRTPEVVHLGAQPGRPRVSVLIPLYRTLSFLRAQVAAFACDPEWREVETIFVLDSPEQRAEVEHLLRGLVRMFGLPATLVVMPRNLGYAAANNAGAALARAPLLLLLNSDVVPDRAGWLSRLAAPLSDRRVGAVGARLLFEDGSLQHAGLYFERADDGTWFNHHYHKGFPRGFAAAARPRAVPAVTGAALLVRRRLFERVGGVSEDYIIGDYEDSDLCLKLREVRTDIAYAPAATLWHFERRSIREHQGYARTLASLYNRRLHTARWGDAIARLMRRFPRGGAA